MRIIEINGIKLEIDERTARTVDQYRVGQRVKVLVKKYGDTFEIHPGVIVGFCDFKDLPSIEIMYYERASWKTGGFLFLVLNAKSKDVEICPVNDVEILLDKEEVLEKFRRASEEKEEELRMLRLKQEYFETRFAQAFIETVASTPSAKEGA